MRRWTVLLACFIGMSVSQAAVFTSPLGLYMKAITTEFGWSRTAFSAVVSITAIGNAIMFPLSGWAADRFGAVRCIVVGLLAGSLSCAALALARSYNAFVAVACFASMTGCLALYPSYFKVLRGWFGRNLGFALAAAAAGIPIGVVAFSYLIQSILGSSGWRRAFVITSAVALVIGLANVIFLVRENRGPFPAQERTLKDDGDASAGLSFAEAIRAKDFWLFSVAFVLIVIAGAGASLHLPALIADRGGSSTAVASAVGAIALGSLSGRVFSGFLLDRLSIRIVSTAFFLAQALGILMLWAHVSFVIGAAFLMGAAQGAELDIMGFVVARRFGRRAYARILGCSIAIAQVGVIIGPLSMGLVFDATRSYDVALLLSAMLPLAAIALTMRASRIPVHSRERIVAASLAAP